MNFWIVGGLVVVAFSAAIVGGIMAAKQDIARDAKMADRLDMQRKLRRKLDELENMRNGGAV